MIYGGFLIEFNYKGSTFIHFDGPHSTIEDATKIYNNLRKLDRIDSARIVRIVSNPSNPAWI